MSKIFVLGSLERLTIETGGTLKEKECRILTETNGDVLLDLSETKSLDSSGIGWMISLQANLNKFGRKLAILIPNKELISILKAGRVENHFTIFQRRDDAEKYLTIGSVS